MIAKGPCPARHDQHGVELRPVAHRDHHFAPNVLELGARRVEALRNVAALGDRRDGRVEGLGNVAAGLDRRLHVASGNRSRRERKRDQRKLLQAHAAPLGAGKITAKSFALAVPRRYASPGTR
jgi:hypothetical protein